MKVLIISPLIILFMTPIQVASQEIRIPIIPFENKPASINMKVHGRCKSFTNYEKCIKRLSTNKNDYFN